ncbi:hypothetical protein EJ04DRAFT_460223 [Polyplosphaeria fusca]|uniref:CENP-V/GFA domain-containing protein n=1 Tax=Polyplosphaeria fusca TaxID=682080 RepID=A0A9P4R6I4_9PLEO|nr:hypothetical protein EJ04DRAFT_460223 [Polyplosphaeria fusca]
MSFAEADKSKPYFPLSRGGPNDGFSNEDSASATCFCGAVQLEFPLKAPGFVKDSNHICNCTDCHKIHSSMFGSNFIVLNTHLKHLRGESDLATYSLSTTTTTGNTMTNYFCKTCGSLMYRRGTGFPGTSIMRIGTVDDFTLMETVLKPDIEQFIKDRVSWLGDVKGAKHVQGYHWAPEE